MIRGILFYLAGVGISLPALAASSLTLNDFLTLQLHQHFKIWQRDTQQEAQLLARQIGQNYWYPQLVTHADWQESATFQESQNVSEQWKTGLEANWTSPVGTQLELALDRLHGDGLGSPADTDKQQSAHEMSISLSQPLLKHYRPDYNRLSLSKAENQWQTYLNEGKLLQLQILKDALQRFVEFQVQHETWEIQQSLLTSIKKSLYLTERLYQVGKATQYDLAQARLNLDSQQTEVDSALLEQQLVMQQAFMTLKETDNPSLQPLVSLSQLTNRLSSLLLTATVNQWQQHPEWQEAKLSLAASHFDYLLEVESHKPDLDVFYQHEKNFYGRSVDNETNTYGLRFTYTLTNKSTYQQQASLKAQQDSAELEVHRIEQQLRVQYQALKARARVLQKQTQIHQQEVALARKGVTEQLQRYQVGDASFYSLQERQQTLLDKELDSLSGQQALADVLIQLAYYQQLDIRKEPPF